MIRVAKATEKLEQRLRSQHEERNRQSFAFGYRLLDIREQLLSARADSWRARHEDRLGRSLKTLTLVIAFGTFLVTIAEGTLLAWGAAIIIALLGLGSEVFTWKQSKVEQKEIEFELQSLAKQNAAITRSKLSDDVNSAIMNLRAAKRRGDEGQVQHELGELDGVIAELERLGQPGLSDQDALVFAGAEDRRAQLLNWCRRCIA